MQKEVFKNIFQIKVPLPQNPLRYTNAYLLRGERSLLIDTAFDNEESYGSLAKDLQSLDVSFENLDVFITHLHSDHSALSYRFSRLDGVRVFASEKDSKIINLATHNDYWEKMTEMFISHGFPINSFTSKMNTHLGWEYHPSVEAKFAIAKGGDVFAYGDYKLECIETPGHSPGHLCLYDRQNKILFAGDMILGKITPVIAPEYNFTNPLSNYFESLKKIKALDIKKTFPGHREIIDDTQVRVCELERHHFARLEEIKKIISKMNYEPEKYTLGYNAFDIAAKMSWDLKFRSWEDFPMLQKWFATGEAIAHLSAQL